MSHEVVTKGPRRADAQRNYEVLLATARAAIGEHGDDIVLEDIARDAGVGIGTLYRHFPTRQDLLEAAFLDVVGELRVAAEELAEGGDAFAALESWLRLQLDLGYSGRCMGATVMSAKHQDGSEIQTACVAMRDAGTVLLHRAQVAGEVRPGVEMSDLIRLIHGIVLSDRLAPNREFVERMFNLVLAGIRP